MQFKVEYGFGVGEDRHGKSISRNRLRQSLELLTLEASRLFGGVTIYETTGAWVNPAGRLVQEPGRTLMVLAACEDGGYSELKQIIDSFGEMIKSTLEQETIVQSITETHFKFV
jgi:hypothetical protein